MALPLAVCANGLYVYLGVFGEVEMPARGIYRVRHGWGDEDSVCVRYDDGTHLEMSRQMYRMHDYKPAFDDLPWKIKEPPQHPRGH
jgi:hypothetical protein